MLVDGDFLTSYLDKYLLLMATKRRLRYEGSDGLESLLPENFFRLSAHRRHFYTAGIPSSKGTKKS